MKKFIFSLFAMVIATMAFVSCSKCSHDADADVPVVETITTKTINADKSHMDSIDKEYSYFESCFTFAGTIDTLATPDVISVSNVFQTVDKAKGEPTVYISNHSMDKSEVANWDVKVGSFWMEDFNLNDYEIKLSLEDAFEQMHKSNITKPVTKFCVLRAQLGPKRCNAQYIFGNDNTGLIFVDAVNGNVTNINPVFENFIGLSKDSLNLE